VPEQEKFVYQWPEDPNDTAIDRVLLALEDDAPSQEAYNMYSLVNASATNLVKGLHTNLPVDRTECISPSNEQLAPLKEALEMIETSPVAYGLDDTSRLEVLEEYLGENMSLYWMDSEWVVYEDSYRNSELQFTGPPANEESFLLLKYFCDYLHPIYSQQNLPLLSHFNQQLNAAEVAEVCTYLASFFVGG
jgi:hypothetical protein